MGDPLSGKKPIISGHRPDGTVNTNDVQATNNTSLQGKKVAHRKSPPKPPANELKYTDEFLRNRALPEPPVEQASHRVNLSPKSEKKAPPVSDRLKRPQRPAPNPPLTNNTKLSEGSSQGQEVCAKINDDLKKYGFKLYPDPGPKTDCDPKGLGGMEQLRQFLRHMHGYDRKNSIADIAKCIANSPLDKLLKGNDIYIYNKDGDITASDQKPKISFLTLEGKKVLEAQKQVQTWALSAVTDTELRDIIRLKAGKRVDVPASYKIKKEINLKFLKKLKGETKNHSNEGRDMFRRYRADLERKAESVVMRQTIYFTNDPDGSVLDDPREHIVYYACYPRLNKNSRDMEHYTSGSDGSAVLIDEKKHELTNHYKRIILQQLVVASTNDEDIDLQVPNAFLYGLREDQQKIAKGIFMDALYSAARTAKANPNVFGNVKAIYTHWDAKEIPKDLAGFVLSNPGDAFAPDDIRLNGRRAAVCIMGDGVGPAGNGALGDRARRGFEENTGRRAGATVEAVGPAMNPHCGRNLFSFGDEVEKIINGDA